MRPVTSRRTRRFRAPLLMCLAVLIVPSVASAERAGSSLRALQAGDLDAGHKFTCAVVDDGSAWCWGDDAAGGLGNGDPRQSEPAPVRVLLPQGRRARSISAGTFHACAVLDDGAVWCWGLDATGALGDREPAADRAAPVRAELPLDRRAIAVSAGSEHTCAVLNDQSAWCWGSDKDGRLGNGGANQNSEVPSQVSLPAGRGALAVSAGGFHTCAILDDESTWCWGFGAGGYEGGTKRRPRAE